MKKSTFCAGLSAMALALITGVVQAADTKLDRSALLKLADNYLASLVAHDASKVPLTADGE